MPDPLLHEDRLDYTPVTRSVPLARTRTARLVAEWGYQGLAGDVALVVSELMTNALLHGSIRAGSSAYASPPQPPHCASR